MTDQVIFDRGYRTYDGPRAGPSGARKAVFKEGLRRVLGLRRKARKKIFPWSLITIAVIAAAVFVGIHWAIGDIAESVGEGVPSYGGLFDFYSAISLLFIAFAAPQLLIPDRTKGVLSVYFSRPLTVDGYLSSKVGAFAALIGAFYIVPQLVLHIGLSLISDDGFIPYMTDNLDILWKVPLTTLAFVALHGGTCLPVVCRYQPHRHCRRCLSRSADSRRRHRRSGGRGVVPGSSLVLAAGPRPTSEDHP